MPVKLKFPGKGKQKPKASKQPTTSARKKRKVDSSDDDTLTPLPSSDEEAEESEHNMGVDDNTSASAGPSQPFVRQSRRQKDTDRRPSKGPQSLFDNDEDVVMTAASTASFDDVPPLSRSPSPQPSRAKRNKKKATTAVFSSDDDGFGYVDDGARQDDADDDFVMDSPPRKSITKRGGGQVASRGRGRGGRSKGSTSDKPILVKDETKSKPESAVGSKRRRDSGATVNNETGPVEKGGASGPSKEIAREELSIPAQLPSQKFRKLPTIKKIKNVGVGGPGSPSVTTPKDELGLSRKPSTAAQPKAADLDLSSKDVYNSLFKGTGLASAPRVGVNSRLKEEERRKELMKMRDEARAIRMAALQRGSFDLTRGQERITAFEDELRARNSPALYPNHLGSAIKYYYTKQKQTEASIGDAT